MPYFAERRRLADVGAAETRGESFWTTTLPVAVRVKIGYVWGDLQEKLSIDGQRR